MTSIQLDLVTLQKKIQELADDGINSIRLTIHNETEDQNDCFSGFLYVEGYTEDGFIRDYESIDSLVPPDPKIPRITYLQNYTKQA